MQKIETIAELEELYPTVSPSSLKKVARQVTPMYGRWIEAARFCVLSTIGPEGVHGSPRGDDGPVVQIESATRLLLPDWKGNNRLDCLRDIVADGRAALLFMARGTNTTVRVNGRAWLTDDADMRARFERQGKQPTTVIVFDIDQVYMQCAKALMRSDLWNRNDGEGLPTAGDFLAEASDGEFGGAQYDRDYPEYAKSRMW